jgi:hypothetical protein
MTEYEKRIPKLFGNDYRTTTHYGYNAYMKEYMQNYRELLRKEKYHSPPLQDLATPQ